MRRAWAPLLLCAAIGLGFQLGAIPQALAAPADAATVVTGISWDAGREAYVVRATGPLQPRLSQLDAPPRLVIDLPGAQLAPDHLGLPGVRAMGVSRVRAGQPVPGTTRVVLDLLRPVRPRLVAFDGGLLVGLGASTPAVGQPAPRSTSSIQGIRHKNGSLFVLMDVPRPYWSHVIPAGGGRTRLRLIFPNTTLGPGVFGTVAIGSHGLERLTATQAQGEARLDIDMTRPPAFEIVQRQNGWYLRSEALTTARAPGTPAPAPDLPPAERAPDLPRVAATSAPEPVRGQPEAPLTLRKVGNSWTMHVATSRPVRWRVVPVGDDRLHVELQGGSLAVPRDSVYIDNGLIARVRATRAPGDLTRLTIDLDQPVRHLARELPDRRGLALSFSRLSKMRVTLDPGHGGTDSGTTGRGGTREKDVTLAIATRVARTMEANGLSVQMTRMRDLEILLRPRVEMANRNDSDVYVSIHANSFGEQRGVKGIETYYFSDESYPLARAVHRSLVQALGQPDRGVRRNNFYVVHHTRMPAALVEIGYLSNAEEEKLLTDPVYQERAAQAIYEGVKQFMGSRKGPRH
ncbi:MAG: N-acetylmuramoyl-L-alanine amidase [Candidatus Sericytochromatia bacterium]|nr:N-acetylmuramoyl-L-alanine amidase [Candidatus Sericytochromatia bacterium]